MICFTNYFDQEKVRLFVGPDLDPNCLTTFDNLPNSLEIHQTKHYTLAVINLFDLVTAPSVVLPEEFFLEYSSDY